MSSSTQQAGGTSSPAGGHSRQNSSARRQTPIRKSVTGPLEGDDPLSSQTRSRSSSTKPTETSQSSRRPSRSPAAPGPPTVVERQQRNFGYLLRPEVYHQLNVADIPPAFQTDALKPGISDNLDSLIAAGRFRAAAILAAEQLKSLPDPSDHARIFPLLYTRLTCLQILGFHFEAAQEAKSLGDLNSAFYREPATGKHIAPWELRVLTVRLQALAFGDWRRGVVGYYELAREARHFAKRATDAEGPEWRARLAELGLRVGMALVEMGDLDSASRHLKTLNLDDHVEAKVRAQIALISLRVGDVPAAQSYLRDVSGDTSQEDQVLLDALCKMADTDYDAAVEAWERLRSMLTDESGLRTLALQNLAVCLVYAGKVIEARELLQEIVDSGENSHGVLFNLSTILELTSDKAREMKTNLSQKAAAHEPSPLGWERANADFKL